MKKICKIIVSFVVIYPYEITFTLADYCVIPVSSGFGPAVADDVCLNANMSVLDQKINDLNFWQSDAIPVAGESAEAGFDGADRFDIHDDSALNQSRQDLSRAMARQNDKPKAFPRSSFSHICS